jgi:topoisomerase IA-like protein
MNMLYRAGKEMLVNNDLWCDTLTVEDDAVDAALAEGWCLHYSETPARAAEMLAEAEAKAAVAKAEAEAAEAERLAAETKRKPKAD